MADASSATEVATRARKVRVPLALCLLVAAVVAALVSNACIVREEHRLLDAWRRDLGIEAARRGEVVRVWFRERVADADVLADSPVTERALARGADADVADLRRVLDRLRASYGYVEVFVLSAAAKRVASSPDIEPPADVTALALAMSEAARPIVSTVDEEVHLAFASPVPAAAGGVVLEMDLKTTLHPLLENGGSTETAETMLVHARGGDVVFTSPRRSGNAPDRPLALALSKHTRLAAAAAVRGEVGTGDYLDYRGREVLAATSGVGQPGWGVVAKIDRDEALAPLAHYARVAYTLSALAMLAACALSAVVLMRSKTRVLNAELARQRAALALQEVEERNATARHELEAQLVQAQKMEAVGRLAGGIAHDFNNLLTLVLVAADDLQSGIDPSNPLHQDAVDVRQAAVRATELTRQLLTFSRKSVQRRETLDANEALRAVVTLIRRAVREDIEVVLGPCEGAAWISTDRAQLEQALLNLAVNAGDAMPKGGRLTIETRRCGADEAPPRVTLPAARCVLLRMQDTGEGIPSEALDKIFDPFFTTKPVGKGTGLGLAMVYSFVSQSGGIIHVDSEVGKGTAFELFFPECAAPAQPDDASAPAAPTIRGGETLLVVDDSPEVRKVACRVLRGAGHAVIEASNAKEALQLYDQHAARIALVLTDVVMPEMGGRALGEALRARKPSLPVVFMSGYADDASLRADFDATRERFVPKPFSASGLVQAIRAALDVDRERQPS